MKFIALAVALIATDVVSLGSKSQTEDRFENGNYFDVEESDLDSASVGRLNLGFGTDMTNNKSNTGDDTFISRNTDIAKIFDVKGFSRQENVPRYFLRGGHNILFEVGREIELERARNAMKKVLRTQLKVDGPLPPFATKNSQELVVWYSNLIGDLSVEDRSPFRLHRDSTNPGLLRTELWWTGSDFELRSVEVFIGCRRSRLRTACIIPLVVKKSNDLELVLQPARGRTETPLVVTYLLEENLLWIDSASNRRPSPNAGVSYVGPTVKSSGDAVSLQVWPGTQGGSFDARYQTPNQESTSDFLAEPMQ